MNNTNLKRTLVVKVLIVEKRWYTNANNSKTFLGHTLKYNVPERHTPSLNTARGRHK